MDIKVTDLVGVQHDCKSFNAIVGGVNFEFAIYQNPGVESIVELCVIHPTLKRLVPISHYCAGLLNAEQAHDYLDKWVEHKGEGLARKLILAQIANATVLHSELSPLENNIIHELTSNIFKSSKS